MYTTDTSKIRKAIVETTPRTTPFSLTLANVTSNDAKTISPIPMKEAHIFSMPLKNNHPMHI